MSLKFLISSLVLIFSIVAFSKDSSNINLKLKNGINQNLYVCKVGFRPNNCENCNPIDDVMSIHLQDGTNVELRYPNSLNFLPYPQAIVASVSLNSINHSSGWYVTYCLDINQLTNGANLSIFGVTGQVYINGSDDNGYLDQSQLSYLVTHGCGGGESIISGADEDLWDLVKSHETAIFTTGPEPLILSSNPSMKSRCTWTLSFQEISCKAREVNHVSCSNGAASCIPYSTDISSGIDVIIE